MDIERYVQLSGITKKYGENVAIEEADFSIKKGELTALLGPSGSGKTTILRMIAGLENPTSGDIYIDGVRVNDLSPSERNIGFVFQSYALFRYMTVKNNIAYGLKVRKMPKAEINVKVDEMLELIGLKDYAKRYPNELSGGQRQRVAFARAMAVNPSILLLDEPFSAIDAKVRRELRSWLRDIVHKVGITSVFVTHDQDEAVEVADEIIVMSEGRVEQIGSAQDIYRKPETAFVAGFIGNGISIADIHSLKGFEEYSDEYKGAMIRPEFVEAFKPDNLDFKEMMDATSEGVIEDIKFIGNALEIKLRVGEESLITHRSLERRGINIGEKMRVLVYRVLAFDGHQVNLLKNANLEHLRLHSKQMQKNIYGADGYFVG